MNCEEFKNGVSNNLINDDDFKNHLESCESCKAFINQELKEPPKGIKQEIWDNLKKTSSEQLIISDNFEKKDNNDEITDESNKSFMDYYFSGLKYGVVFGLAIVIGFSIIQNNSEVNKAENNNEKSSKIEDDLTVNKIASTSITIKENVKNKSSNLE